MSQAIKNPDKMSKQELRNEVKYLREKLARANTNSKGCNRRLASGQWWGYCGETDMGQTGPALCEDCGGTFKLEETEMDEYQQILDEATLVITDEPPDISVTFETVSETKERIQRIVEDLERKAKQGPLYTNQTLYNQSNQAIAIIASALRKEFLK